MKCTTGGTVGDAAAVGVGPTGDGVAAGGGVYVAVVVGATVADTGNRVTIPARVAGITVSAAVVGVAAVQAVRTNPIMASPNWRQIPAFAG